MILIISRSRTSRKKLNYLECSTSRLADNSHHYIVIERLKYDRLS